MANKVVISGNAGERNSQGIIGTARSGMCMEIRLYDGDEPGRVADAVYLTVGATEVLGAAGADLDRGNIQLHANCRGA